MNLKLLIDGRIDPIGLEECPAFTWLIGTDKKNVRQTAYQIRVTSGENEVLDTGRTESDMSAHVREEYPLRPLTRYEVSVTVWISTGETQTVSGSFETGRLSMPWIGRWIAGRTKVDDDRVLPPLLFRKEIYLTKRPVRARLFAAALGLYHITVDGRDITRDYFEPGYTQYTERVPYKEYDVTEQFAEGEHTIYAELAGGWYTGRLGLVERQNMWGKKRAFLAELHILYEDGTQEVIATDLSWLVTEDGPRRFAGFFDGEIYQADRQDASGWHWEQVRLCEEEAAQLSPYDGTPVRLHERLDPIHVFTQGDGKVICDFGRNFAGVISIEDLFLEKKRTIVIRHGEILDAKNRLYIGNLRTARARLIYRGTAGINSYTPRFTYMGFRHVQIEGVTEQEVREHICAYEIYSDMPVTGSFSCSDTRINQLQANILTSQKANFVEIPTDCPQRDERCGWTGDIAMFIPTAAWNMDLSLFMRKWLHDVRLAQSPKGVIPDIVPTNHITDLKDGYFSLIFKTGSAVWGDVITIAPWTMYWQTGDVRFLQDNYEAMRSWVDYVSRRAAFLSRGDQRYIWSIGFQYGDWLAPGEDVGKNMAKGKWIATAFFAHSAWIVARTAAILGDHEGARHYSKLFSRIRQAFRRVFLDRDGHIRNGFQTIYVLAICFGLLDGQEEQTALQDLVRDIEVHGNHLATGFPGTPFINFALSDHGRGDKAFDLLLQDTAPGWLYPVTCGATSIWERWDALKEDGTVNEDKMGDSNMVSFNHYSYGAIGDWLYRRVGGLEALEPGYRKFRIRPLTNGPISSAAVSLDTSYGTIQSAWKKGEDGAVSLEVTVPPNTTAVVELPCGTRRIKRTLGSGAWEISGKIPDE